MTDHAVVATLFSGIEHATARAGIRRVGLLITLRAVRALTKALALDYASKKIRVNNIVPGYVRTAMTEKSYLDDKLNRERIDRMMIPRWGEAEDLVGAAI